MIRVNSAAGRDASNRLVTLARISGTGASFGFEFLLRQHTRIVLAPMCCFALRDRPAPPRGRGGEARGGVDVWADRPRRTRPYHPTAGRTGLRCRSDAGVQ